MVGKDLLRGRYAASTRRCLALCVLLTMCISWGQVRAAAPDTPTLSVDAGQKRGAIDPRVFASNIDGSAIIPIDMMPQVKAMNLKYMRFGGNWSDTHDLSPSTVDFVVLQSQLAGTEPALSVRLEHGTPEAAAEVVRYANIEKKYNIRYWSIGNEPNLFYKHPNIDHYNTEDFNTNWRKWAMAMRAVDPTILLVGPDLSQYTGNAATNPKDSAGRDWMTEFLKANGDLVDIVSIHRYPFPNPPGHITTIDELRATSKEWDQTIPYLRDLIKTTTGRDIPIGVTELNSHWSQAVGGEATPDSFYNAIWFADVLGRLIRNQVAIVVYFRVADDGTYGLITAYDVHPTYYVYPLYTKFGRQLLASDSNHPDLSITAALRDDGALTMMIVNLGPTELKPTLDLKGFTASGDAEVWRFDATHKAEKVGTQTITNGQTLTIPGQSITLYIVKGS